MERELGYVALGEVNLPLFTQLLGTGECVSDGKRLKLKEFNGGKGIHKRIGEKCEPLEISFTPLRLIDWCNRKVQFTQNLTINFSSGVSIDIACWDEEKGMCYLSQEPVVIKWTKEDVQ